MPGARCAALGAWCGALGALLALPAAAAAQAPGSPRGLEVDAGINWIGVTSLGARHAGLTAPGGSTLPLFTVSSDLAASLGSEAHVVFPLTRRLHAEVSGSWRRADLQSSITGDFEGAEPAFATVAVSTYTGEGSIVWLLGRRGRFDPFVRGGGGWIRDVTADGLLAADGVIANAGAGVKYWIRERSRGALKRFGLRSELRLVSRSGGLLLAAGSTRRMAPAASVSAMLGF